MISTLSNEYSYKENSGNDIVFLSKPTELITRESLVINKINNIQGYEDYINSHFTNNNKKFNWLLIPSNFKPSLPNDLYILEKTEVGKKLVFIRLDDSTFPQVEGVKPLEVKDIVRKESGELLIKLALNPEDIQDMINTRSGIPGTSKTPTPQEKSWLEKPIQEFCYKANPQKSMDKGYVYYSICE